MYDRHETVSRSVSEQARNELCQTTPKGDERKEIERTLRIAKPFSDPGSGDEGGAGETCKAQCCGRGNELEEDADVRVLLEDSLNLLVIVSAKRHGATIRWFEMAKKLRIAVTVSRGCQQTWVEACHILLTAVSIGLNCSRECCGHQRHRGVTAKRRTTS